ncbi:transporter [Rhizobium glycinendophyticum]|uniref:Transporter n=1 Tax=Rhizobium glycinendophyticum TaxID=2589807 RepID=A0A504UTE7_9HYPH|nr:transporter [Rhizobium glycinendophyticum]TPP11906.1 transporter [Rhizobium glycinendophyticum]
MFPLTSPIPGLVWAYRIIPGLRSERLPADCSALDVQPGDDFIWLHLNLADTRLPAFLEQFPGLTQPVLSALTTHDTHAALAIDEGLLFGTLIDFQREFDATTRDIGWLHFALTDRFIITTRLQPIRSVDKVRAAVEKNAARYATPLQLFEVLVAEFQRGLIAVVLELTDELNQIEDLVYGSELRDERRRLTPVRRLIVRLHRHLRTMLLIMRRASATDDDEIPDGVEDSLIRLSGRLEAVDQDVQALADRARLLHEELDSKQSAETNRHLYILSLMTALLLPPSLVTGFFGMNTTNLPLADGMHGTGYAFAFIVISVMLSWWVLRRTGIL